MTSFVIQLFHQYGDVLRKSADIGKRFKWYSKNLYCMRRVSDDD